jgi:transposase-like protein
MTQRSKCSKAFKLEAADLVTDGTVTIVQAARYLDVNENVLNRWIR